MRENTRLGIAVPFTPSINPLPLPFAICYLRFTIGYPGPVLESVDTLMMRMKGEIKPAVRR
jgi:hypothetical protein